MSRASWALVALLAVGCVEEQVQFALPPLDGRVASWIIVRHIEHPELYAADERTPLRLPIEDTPMRLELVAFSQSLEELGLSPGPLPTADPNAPSRVLPEALLSFEADVDAAGEGGWREAPSSVLVRQHRLPAVSPCRELVTEVGVLPTIGDVTWAVSLDADTVLLGSDRGEIMRFRAGVGPTLLEVVREPGVSNQHTLGALLDRQGRLWLGDQDGGLWVATVVGDRVSLVRRVGPTDHGLIITLDGDPADPEDQLFAMTSSGTIARLSVDHWETVDQLASPLHSDNNNTLVWLGRDEVFAGTSAWPYVRVLRGGAREDIRLAEAGSAAAITGMSLVSPREVVVGLSGGNLIRYAEGRWSFLGRSRVTLDVHVFHRAWGQGFLYAGAFGYVAEWHETAGFCPGAESPLAALTVHYIVPVGDALLMVGDEPPGRNPTPYTLLRSR